MSLQVIFIVQKLLLFFATSNFRALLYRRDYAVGGVSYGHLRTAWRNAMRGYQQGHQNLLYAVNSYASYVIDSILIKYLAA
jgi:hypothetical protein